MRFQLIVSPLALVLAVLPSCRREAARSDLAVETTPDPAVERAELERWQLAREREALEWERQEMQRRLAAAEAEGAAQLDGMLGELAVLESELARREAMIGYGLGDVPAATPAVSEPLYDPVPVVEADPLPAVEDYGLFYDELEPYGDWYESVDYGYVWQPTVVVHNAGWRPYCHGRWAWTDCGWCWISCEPFGWATCHYGRWTTIPGRGWAWVPGETWAPAWVCWRMGRDHIGWAPLPPGCGDRRRAVWGSGIEREFGIGADRFCFVRKKHFGDLASRHRLPPDANRALFDSTTGVTLLRRRGGRVWSGGPDYESLSRDLGRRVARYRLRPGMFDRESRWAEPVGDRLEVYAPSVAARWNPLLEPQRLAGRIERVSGRGTVTALWATRLRNERAGQRQLAEREVARLGSGTDLGELRRQQLQVNRERVRGVLARTDPGAAKGSRMGAAGSSAPSSVARRSWGRREASAGLGSRSAAESLRHVTTTHSSTTASGAPDRSSARLHGGLDRPDPGLSAARRGLAQVFRQKLEEVRGQLDRQRQQGNRRVLRPVSSTAHSSRESGEMRTDPGAVADSRAALRSSRGLEVSRSPVPRRQQAEFRVPRSDRTAAPAPRVGAPQPIARVGRSRVAASPRRQPTVVQPQQVRQAVARAPRETRQRSAPKAAQRSRTPQVRQVRQASRPTGGGRTSAGRQSPVRQQSRQSSSRQSSNQSSRRIGGRFR